MVAVGKEHRVGNVRSEVSGTEKDRSGEAKLKMNSKPETVPSDWPATQTHAFRQRWTSRDWRSHIRTLAKGSPLDEAARGTLERILLRVPVNDEPAWFDAVESLLKTPYDAAKGSADATKFLRSEHSYDNSDPEREERISADPARRWTRISPEHYQREGEWFEVDKSDLDHVVIRIRVLLAGASDDVEKIRSTEDAIEKHLSSDGLTVDLEFVSEPADGVYRVDVDPSRYPNARNWTTNVSQTAHELMHLLGLHDEYDYRRYADYAGMPQEYRLHLLEAQLNRPSAPDEADGIMADDKKKPLPRHILAAAGVAPQWG